MGYHALYQNHGSHQKMWFLGTRQRTCRWRSRSQAAGRSAPAEFLRRYHNDLDIDQFEARPLHQDVLDILPQKVHLDPRGAQSELDVFKLTSAGNRLSEVWSLSAISTKPSFSLFRAQPLCANAGSNQLALQCSLFCILMATRQTERYGKFDLYVLIVLSHQVSVKVIKLSNNAVQSSGGWLRSGTQPL